MIVNVEEAERLKLLAQREKQFFKKGEDGSGWAALGDDAAAARGQHGRLGEASL